MIVRYPVKCLTCDTSYTLRMQMGHDREQVHEITCPTCQEEFIVALDVDFEEVTYKVRCVENCKQGAEEGMIINIDPYSPIPSNARHEDFVFPWLQHARHNLNIEEKLEQLPQPSKGASGPFFVDVNELIGGHHLILDDWSHIKKGWSLSLRGNTELADMQFKKYKDLPEDENPDLDHAVFAFSLHLASPGYYELFQRAAEVYSDLVDTHRAQVDEFRSYYRDNLRTKNLESYLDIYTQYFRHYSDFSQTLLYVKNRTDVPEGSEVSSRSFKKTKLFYGNAFEALTSGFITLACLNNIQAGRKYDQFERMDLAKYVTINKANRSNPFSDNPVFSEFAHCIDSVLRNASHHGAIRYDPVRSLVIYRSGGSGAEHRMTYANYVTKCNEIMLSIASLVALEILIMF